MTFVRLPETADRGFDKVSELPEKIEGQLHFETGVTLAFLGERWRDAGLIEKAVSALRESLAGGWRPGDHWVDRQNVLGMSLFSLGEITGDPGFFEQAAAAFRAALYPHPSEDAINVGGLFAALSALTGGDSYAAIQDHEVAALHAAQGENVSGDTLNAHRRSVYLFGHSGPEQFEEPARIFREMLKKRTGDGPAKEWAKPNYQLHDDPDFVSTRTTQAPAYTELLKQKVAVIRSALEERSRKRAPADRFASQNEIGLALGFFGERIGHMDTVEEAVAAFRAALAGLSRERTPVEWAGTQDRLGKALRLLGERRSDAGFLEQSIEAYGASLTVYSRERTPLERAMAQFRLGTCLRLLFERTGNSLLPGQAATAFRAALEVLSRKRTPVEWAAAQFNLGTSLCIQHDCEESGGVDPRPPEDSVDTDRLEEAVAAFRAVLKGRTQQGLKKLDDGEGEAACLARVKGLVLEPMPLYRAETRKRLGNTLRALGTLKRDTGLLDEGADALRAALDELGHADRERKVKRLGKYDLDEVRYCLAATLRLLGVHGGETGPLEMAAAAYEAIEAIAYDQRWMAGNESRSLPFESSRAGFALGETLLTLFRRKGDTRVLEEANAAYRRTLASRASEGRASEYGYAPLDWTETQNRFGGTLLLMGELRRDGALLADAAGAYRAALEGFACEHAPLRRAERLNGLGTALLCRNALESGDVGLEDAVGAFRAALEAYSRDRLPFRWAAMQCNLGLALGRLGRHREDTGLQDHAVAAFRAAREVDIHEQGSGALAETRYWVTMQRSIGLCLIDMHRDDLMLLDEGADALRAALENCPPDRLPILWARVQDDLAAALPDLGDGRIDAGVHEQAAALRPAHQGKHDRVPKPSETAIWHNPHERFSILVSVATDDRFMHPDKTDGVFGPARPAAWHPARSP